MKTFKLKNSDLLSRNIDAFENPVLKAAAVQVIEGEAGGWKSHSSWSNFSKYGDGPDTIAAL